MHRTVRESSPTVLPEPARGRAVPLGPALLGIGGLALVGAGALLGWQRGAMVSLGDSMLAAIAWCF